MPILVPFGLKRKTLVILSGAEGSSGSVVYFLPMLYSSRKVPGTSTFTWCPVPKRELRSELLELLLELCCSILSVSSLSCSCLCCSILSCSILICSCLCCSILSFSILICSCLCCSILSFSMRICSCLCCSILSFSIRICSCLCCSILCCSILSFSSLCCSRL